MRVGDIDGEVALLGALGADFGDEMVDIVEGVGEGQASPAAVDDGIGLGPLALDIMMLAVHPLQPGFALSLPPAHQPTPCCWSPSSSRPTSQTSQPRTGVLWPTGSSTQVLPYIRANTTHASPPRMLRGVRAPLD